MRTRSQLFNANRYIKASINASPLRDPRGTSRTPSPSGTLTPPLNKLPPGFAVFAFSEVASVRCVITNQFALHSLTRNFILFEKRESPGDRLRGRNFQKRKSFAALSKGVLLFTNHLLTPLAVRNPSGVT